MAAAGKAISPREFSKLLDKGTIDGVVLFAGERGLVQRSVDAALEALVKPEERELAVAVYHSDDIDESSLAAELRTPPMFADRRIVLLRRADKFNVGTETSAFLQFLKEPLDSTVLLLSAPDMDRRKRLYGLVKKHGLVVDCKKLDRRTAPEFVVGQVGDAGKRIDQGAVRTLIELVGTDSALLTNEIRNLVNYTGDRTSVTEDDVMMMTANLREESVFNLTDAIADRDVAGALAALEQLLDDGAEPVYVLMMVEWLLRRLYAARVAVDGGTSPEEAAEMAGVPHYFRRKFIAQVDNFSLSELVRLFDLLLDTDVALRQSGRKTRIEMELCVTRAAGDPAPRSLR